jgi:hypothetical protein
VPQHLLVALQVRLPYKLELAVPVVQQELVGWLELLPFKVVTVVLVDQVLVTGVMALL